MALVFFFYGLAFFVLGLSILVYPKKQSAFALAKHLNLLAGFGLIHGANEWLDLFILIKVPDPGNWLEIGRMIALPVSFVFLVQFGVRNIIECTGRHRWLRALSIVLPGAWAVVFLVSEQHMLVGDIWGRYLIAIPGTLLTAYGLWLHHWTLQDPEIKGAVRSLQCAAVTFVVYGVTAGMIVKAADFFPARVLNYDVFMDVFGFPVQVMRTGCAIGLAFCTLHLVSIFHWETQNRLRESELRVRTVAQAAPVILFMEDREGRLSFVQGKGLETLGLKAKDLIGKSVSALFGELPCSDSRHNCLSEKGSCSCRLSVGYATFDVSYSAVHDNSGEISGAIGIALDVSDRLQSERELDRYRQEMNRMQRLTELGTMSTAMAEHISKPLNISQLLLQRLIGQIDRSRHPQEVVRPLEKAFSELTEAMTILQRFCDVAHIAPLEQAKPVDFYHLGHKVASAFSERADRMNLHIDIDGLDCVANLYVAERELEYIFFVMVQHALEKARPDVQESLRIRCADAKDEVILEFCDTCASLASDQLSHVFEPFVLSNGSDNGTDLGLAVIKQMVETHNGSIEVRSTSDEGTTFRIILPTQS